METDRRRGLGNRRKKVGKKNDWARSLHPSLPPSPSLPRKRSAIAQQKRILLPSCRGYEGEGAARLTRPGRRRTKQRRDIRTGRAAGAGGGPRHGFQRVVAGRAWTWPGQRGKIFLRTWSGKSGQIFLRRC
eukprot:73480-Chlamydomonas_euryale.AAC.3